MHRHALSFVICAIFAAVTARAADDVRFEYRFAKGESATYRVTSDASTVKVIEDAKLTQRIQFDDVTQRTCVEVGDGGEMTFRAKCKQRKVKADLGRLGSYEYDSTSEESVSGVLGEALNPVFDALSAGTWTYAINPRGQVLKVEGYAELLGDTLTDNPLGLQFVGGPSNDDAKESVGTFLIRFPEHALSIGETWVEKQDREIPDYGRLRSIRTYKFEADVMRDGRRLAQITFEDESTVQIRIKDEKTTVTGELRSKDAGGTAYFDFARGRLVSLAMKGENGGKLTVKDGPKELVVEQSQKQETRVELLDEMRE